MKNRHQNHPVKRLAGRAPFALQKHHAKPVRKRHLVGLSASLLLLIAVTAAGLNYMYAQYDAQVSASLSSRQQLFAHADTSRIVTLRSSIGFGLRIDREVFDATATALENGELEKYDIYNLAPERQYTAVAISPQPSSQVSSALAGSHMTIASSPEVIEAGQRPAKTAELLRQLVAGDAATYSQQKQDEQTVKLAGVDFVRQTFVYTPRQKTKSIFQSAPSQVQAYVGFLPNGAAVTIKLVAPQAATQLSAYDTLLNGLFVNGLQANASSRHITANGRIISAAPAWLQALSLSGLAAAKTNPLDSARIVANNIPAVVKLYHVHCGIIEYRGKAITTNSCTAVSGTGFFVSSDGLVATNGHVVVTDVKETVAGNMTAALLAKMLQVDGYGMRDIADITGQFGSNQMQASVIQAVRQLPSDALRYTQQQDYYIAALASEVPNLQELVKKRTFTDTSTLKQAQLKAVDYSASDISSKTGFSHSDIAVLKLDGSNYPVVRLGSIDGLVQGAGVTVVGYPNDAESNGLVRSDTLQTSATEGIVSAIREVNGNNGKVVQSDVAIGHGNSGGPAFDQTGQVFGIATYLLDGTDGGSGISYLRDVKDLRNVLAANNLRITATSQTQAMWEAGLNDFYAAHYKAAIKKFEQVQKLYGPHTLADQYIGIARAKINAGEEAQNPMLGYLLAAGGLLAFAGVVAMIVAIVRHRSHYHMYQALQLGYLAGPFVGLFGLQHAPVPVPIRHHDEED